jgi:hypothetical protein
MDYLLNVDWKGWLPLVAVVGVLYGLGEIRRILLEIISLNSLPTI